MRSMLFTAFLALFALTACGGGGGDPDVGLDTTDVADVCLPLPADESCIHYANGADCTVQQVYVDEGTACDDDSACTSNDQCQADGSCAGTPIAIDDGLDCTADACDAKTGLTHAITSGCLIDGACYAASGTKPGDPCFVCDPFFPDDWSFNQGATCDDGDACTSDDTCQDGEGGCAGTPRACDDQNPCTFDECTSGACQHQPVNVGCDDGDACTENDRCVDGLCTAGTPLDCDDADACTADGCDSASGCVHGPDLSACDDDNDCTLDSCAPTGCSHEPLASGPCSDHDACTLGDACVDGACVAGGGAPECDDGNACTDDSCLPAAGCVNAFNQSPCDDGVACTDVDTCVYGVCVGDDTLDACAACSYGATGQVHKSLAIQMGSDGKVGSGLDVDDDPATCAPTGKCSSGVDNALALLSLFLNPLFTDGLASGDLTFIVEFQQPAFDGTPFTLNTFFGLPHPYLNPGCAASEDCIYILPYYNFTPDCRPLVSLADATVTGGHISAGGKDAVFPMVLPFDTGITVQLTLLWARFEGEVSIDPETGEILTMEGLVGGAVPKAALTETILAIPDDYFSIDKQQVLNLLDTAVDQDMDLDGDGQMDALSIGFRFSTVPTTVTTLY